MAGPNRYQKKPLSEAWTHYWSVLFPNGIDWQTDLEEELNEHLCFPGEAEVFSRKRPERELPTWADDLAIRIRDNAVGVEIKSTDFGTVPLFNISNLPVLSNWRGKNPLAKVAEQSSLKDREKDQCREFCHAVIRTCGNRIHSRLLRVIKETERPEVEIYCRPSGDVFAKEKRIPGFGLTEIAQIDITNNKLQDRLGLAKYCQVHIKQRKASPLKAGPHGSFHDQDGALVEKMKSLIDKGKARSVRQAAQHVLSKAPRRSNSSYESVLRRLQNKFYETYRDYLNRRSQKGP